MNAETREAIRKDLEAYIKTHELVHDCRRLIDWYSTSRVVGCTTCGLWEEALEINYTDHDGSRRTATVSINLPEFLETV
ncbi:hypothetical protein HMPREF9336_04182 [Segniliparus rugosus ATCC BAA-974]|uniref:Uncharacterized protein n=1 Tax=Segniliparus rugosus (strain ATCC BAA-974 / DSM 45345 / CCUG 50838 / CIP 108380 / JCM 13579 / CDC 945) TaxID=679197 RepID=U1LMW3_SEGRC|nr:hypothetical protein HMPREF9336_04182 [Segniliparus rugosus ATCC BAA-974]